MTSVPKVFAGGDIVGGPGLILHAVRDARRAALGIASFLKPNEKAA
jgi:thioredoxin reductase